MLFFYPKFNSFDFRCKKTLRYSFNPILLIQVSFKSYLMLNMYQIIDKA